MASYLVVSELIYIMDSLIIGMIWISLPDYRYQKIFGRISEIEEQIQFVESYLRDFDLDVAFCHNDYYANNIIYNQEEGSCSVYKHLIIS